ncbi:MAG TPA: ABC transporter permease [Pseudonocardiaceae bacterium]
MAALPASPVVRGAIGVALFLALGEIVGRVGIVARNYLPPTSDVVRALWVMLTEQGFTEHILSTTGNWLLGLATAVAVGVPLGLLLGSVPFLNEISRLIVEFLRPIPSVALIPLAVLVLGTGTEMRVFIMTFAAVWPILFNTIYGLMEVDPQAKETARSYGSSRLGVVLRVSLPSAAPFVLTGIRTAAAIALILEVTAELFGGGRSGIGTVIGVAIYGSGEKDVVLAGAFVTGLIGLAANLALEYAGRRGLVWAHQEGGGR